MQGTIAEAQRMSSVAPVSLFHKTTTRTTIGDFLFPAGSAFVANQSFIMNDEQHFARPELFNPQRHIGSDGK